MRPLPVWPEPAAASFAHLTDRELVNRYRYATLSTLERALLGRFQGLLELREEWEELLDNWDFGSAQKRLSETPPTEDEVELLRVLNAHSVGSVHDLLCVRDGMPDDDVDDFLRRIGVAP